ncbi:MAG: response regulator [Armatimonadetes bacterium]|nr:response regulator [Armatimonadota bacterium]
MPETATVRLLLVDDDPDQLDLCRVNLERGLANAQVTCARSGDECLALMRTQEFDAVILDYKMPGMDGIAALRQVRQLQPKTLPVVMTGYGDEGVAVAAMKQGAADYVMKTLDYARVLPSVIARCLEIQRQQRELEAERTRNIQLAMVIQTTRTLAHEVNNPLQVITGTAELLAGALAEREPELAARAAKMVDVCEQIANVIRRLYRVTNPTCQTRMGLAMLDLDASSAQDPGEDADGLSCRLPAR